MPVRDYRIDIRFNETEKLAVGRAARKSGYKNTSAFVRAALAGILRTGIDGPTDRRLAVIELLLERLNAKMQQIILLRPGKSSGFELSAIAADVAQISNDLKIEIHKLRDLPHERCRAEGATWR
jgi:hypothetical protein